MRKLSERVCPDFLVLKVARVRIVLDAMLEKDWFVQLETKEKL